MSSTIAPQTALPNSRALRALKTITIKSEAKHWEPEQSLVADGEPRFLGDSTVTVTWDLANGTARSEWTRAMKYPAIRTLKYTEVVTPKLGSVADEKGATAMSGGYAPQPATS